MGGGGQRLGTAAGLLASGAALAAVGCAASPPGSLYGLLAAGFGLALAAVGLRSTAAGRQPARLARLWGGALLLALASLAAQALVQGLPAAPRAEAALEVLGLQRMAGPGGFIRGVGGRAVSTVLAAAHLACLRGRRAGWLTGAQLPAGAGAGRPRGEGGGVQPSLVVGITWRRARLFLALAAVAAGVAGCSWPGLLSLPYLLALAAAAVVLALGGFLGSAAGRAAWLCALPPGLARGGLRIFGVYSTLHAAALWLWQNPALHVRDGGPLPSGMSEALGLFWVGHPTAGSSTAALQVLHGSSNAPWRVGRDAKAGRRLK